MRIEEFSDIRMGHAFRSRLANVPDGNVQVIQPKNILMDGSVCFGNDEPLRTDVPVAWSLASKDVLVVNRGRFAAAVFEPQDSATWIVPSSILVLSITSQSVLPEYVACYFNSTNGQRLFSRHCEQTTIPFIGAGNLGRMNIPVPSLERQHALVACGDFVARYAALTSRKQEVMKRILNWELRMGNVTTKGTEFHAMEDMI